MAKILGNRLYLTSPATKERAEQKVKAKGAKFEQLKTRAEKIGITLYDMYKKYYYLSGKDVDTEPLYSLKEVEEAIKYEETKNK